MSNSSNAFYPPQLVYLDVQHLVTFLNNTTCSTEQNMTARHTLSETTGRMFDQS